MLPCRHLCLCDECTQIVRVQTNKCPICRTSKWEVRVDVTSFVQFKLEGSELNVPEWIIYYNKLSFICKKDTTEVYSPFLPSTSSPSHRSTVNEICDHSFMDSLHRSPTLLSPYLKRKVTQLTLARVFYLNWPCCLALQEVNRRLVLGSERAQRSHSIRRVPFDRLALHVPLPYFGSVLSFY